MKLQFIGSGDAFGSGSRFNTCFHITGDKVNFLIDCGASSLIALKANRVALNEVQSILITHFHADHFGGIPFFILEAQLVSKRTKPLTIAGPCGLNKRFELAMEAGFPGSSEIPQNFEISLIELKERQETLIGSLSVTPFIVKHGHPGGPVFAYRVETEGRTIAYTGDTEWTDKLIDVGQNADLFIAEAYSYDKKIKMHLDYTTLAEHLPAVNPKRLVLTHMSEDMLLRRSEVPYEVAEDGMAITV